jgi:hypothetical protein
MKIFYIKIDDEMEGMNAISLVESPAVEHDFICFSKDKEPVKMKFDNSKHIITGVVALADTPIYRYNEKIGEYYVVFSKETILKMVEKYSKDGLFNSVNLQHDDDSFVDGIYMYESYITNKDRGINPKEFEDIPDGSWVCSFKVENEDLWNQIINGDKLNGFSLQGMFELEERFENQFVSQAKEESFDEWLNKYIN